MTHFSQKIIFSVVGVLFVIAIIINQWLSKELATPVNSMPEFIIEETPEPIPVKVEEKDYNPLSDYAPRPSGEGLAQENFVVEKPQRVLDEKIIYEMPTSNRYLLQ